MDPQSLLDSNSSPHHFQEFQEKEGRVESGATRIKRIVTTSWDEGSPYDQQVARLLASRKLTGTFYIPVKGYHKSCRRDLADLHMLDGQRFEIGAFGIAHQDLCACDSKQLPLEIERCKARLEDDLGKAVSMFAYPRGRTNRRVITTLRSAGYKGARTTSLSARGFSFDPFRMPISAHVYPYSRSEYLRTVGQTLDVRRAWMYASRYRRASNWVEFAKVIFDSVLRSGGIWHLYGRSQEIEELRLWDGLREVLDYAANRPGVLYVANGSLVNLQEAKFVGAESYATTPAV